MRALIFAAALLAAMLAPSAFSQDDRPRPVAPQPRSTDTPTNGNGNGAAPAAAPTSWRAKSRPASKKTSRYRCR